MDTLFVGLDVHKLSISVTTAEDGRDGAVRFCGEVANTPEQVRKLSDRLSRPGNRLEFCYEAGGCGYGIYRQLTEMGHGCLVAAPIPLRPVRPGPGYPGLADGQGFRRAVRVPATTPATCPLNP